MKTGCPAEIESAHAILVAAKTHQVFRRSSRVVPTFDMDDSSRTWCLTIRGTRDPPRPIEEATALCQQAARRVQVSPAGATALNRPIHQGDAHGCARIALEDCKSKDVPPQQVGSRGTETGQRIPELIAAKRLLAEPAVRELPQTRGQSTMSRSPIAPISAPRFALRRFSTAAREGGASQLRIPVC